MIAGSSDVESESRPVVDIVIPCWNSERTVGDAIESALDQNYQDAKTLVVDDGSTDNSLRIIKSFSKHIRWCATSHKGACAARNLGLGLATGQYVQFLDADDLLLSDKIAGQVEVLQETGAEFVAGSYFRENAKTGYRTEYVLRKTDPWVALLGAGGGLGITSSNLWRLDALKAVGGWNIEWASSQEAELMFRLLRAGAKVAWDADALTVIRTQEESISYTNGMGCKPSAWRTWVKIREHVVRDLAANGQLTEDRLIAFQGTIIKLARLYRRQDGREAVNAVGRNLAYLRPLRFEGGHNLYRFMFNVLGFKHTERIRTLYGNVRRRLR